MTIAEVADALVAWTPYLAAGFGWNMIVSLAAMAIGTGGASRGGGGSKERWPAAISLTAMAK